MEQTGLRNNFISVRKVGVSSYGGNQNWFDDKSAQGSGCGLICGMDLLVYLSRHHEGCSAKLFSGLTAVDEIPVSVYNSLCGRLRRYLPIIPRFGMTGLVLTAGLNLFFLRNGMPCRAVWGISRDKFWTRMCQMLAADIPVILSIGPNFSRDRSHGLKLYRKFEDGSYMPTSRTRAHYVTVTGMDDSWLRVSSWGRELYIKREEYSGYVLEHSSPIVSNLVYLSIR